MQSNGSQGRKYSAGVLQYNRFQIIVCTPNHIPPTSVVMYNHRAPVVTPTLELFGISQAIKLATTALTTIQ